MSNPLALGAVSAALRNLLDDGMVAAGPSMGSVPVTAIAPDLIDLDGDEPPSLNLYLHRVSPNSGWRNVGLPSRDAGGARLTNPPLALDLHYLVTAYGSADLEAEVLLGYAMHLLHERPVLDRGALVTALDPSPVTADILPPAYQALRAADLADQVASVTVTLDPIGTEEMSRLWSAFQSHYRPTAAYVVTVVLIEAQEPTRSALPVLSRGVVAHPSLEPPLPTVVRVIPPDDQPAAVLGETLRVHGHHLAGSDVEVHFDHPLLDDVRTVTVGVVDDPSGFDVTLPSGVAADADWPAGLWRTSVRLVPDGATAVHDTNVVGLLLAPVVELPPAAISRDAGTGAVTVDVEVHPEVRPSQPATLALGGDVAQADQLTAQEGTLRFRFGPVPDGDQWVRLTVDGVTSRLIDHTTTPPEFDTDQFVTVPA